MKKTQVELDAEELALITKMRDQKAKEEAAEKAASALEVEFKKALKVAEKEIEGHIEEARAALYKAVKASEKYGVPFRTEVVDMGRERQYIPRTFSQKWPGLDDEVLEEFDMYLHEEGVGWEYWSTSSLSC